MTTVLLVVGFIFVTLASRQVGLAAAYGRLPLITGYLAAGAIVGPFCLGWISQEAVLSLRPVDQTALAFIAFAAGSELYLKEIRSQLRSIGIVTAGQFLSVFGLSVAAVMLLADWVPFLGKLSTTSRLGVALMAASILVARSPSSAIAIISELRARGPFTKIALGVTMVMDAVVILSFAIAASVAHTLIAGHGFELKLIAQVLADLVLSLLTGLLVAQLLRIILSADVDGRIKTALMILIGFGTFAGIEQLRHYSVHALHWKIAIEPLLACMIAGFVVTNFGRYRAEFATALEEVAPMIYIAFFTLVGASLALDTLVKLWRVALLLFGVRLIGIHLGSWVSHAVAGDPRLFGRLSWMAYVTQAGVGLGLAKEVAAEFTTFGPEFATMIIAIIVLNQIVGPPLMKWVIKRVGESHLRGEAEPDEVRDALILGIDDQSLAVARQLMAHNWKVIMADRDRSHVEHIAGVEVDARHIERIDEETIGKLLTKATDAVVGMLATDDANYRACEVAFEKHGIKRLVVRVKDLSWSDRFAEIGAEVVEPASAMVNLFDQFVRAPSTAALLLHRDPEHEVVQITLDDPDLEGLPLRDLRLPIDVRVLEITRDGHSMVPSGHTRLKRGDDVTFVGEREHLEEIVARWGY